MAHELPDCQASFSGLRKFRPDGFYQLVISDIIFFDEPSDNERSHSFARRKNGEECILGYFFCFLAVGPAGANIN